MHATITVEGMVVALSPYGLVPSRRAELNNCTRNV